MKYVRLFENEESFNDYELTVNNTPNISFISNRNENNNGIIYTKSVHDYSLDYFTLVAIDDCYFEFKCKSGEFSYSLDNGITWSDYYQSKYGTGNEIFVAADNKILFKGRNLIVTADASGSIPTFKISNDSSIQSQQRFNVEGNIMSLLYGDDFIGQTEIIDNYTGSGEHGYTFNNLLSHATTLINAKNLILPATTLLNGCYMYMFSSCTSLETAPALPAPTLVNSCYCGMFNSCLSLNYVKCLATDISARYATSYWMYNVNAPGKFIKAPNMNNWTIGQDGIPSGWTIKNVNE